MPTRRSLLIGAGAVGVAAALPAAGLYAAHRADADDTELVPDMLAHDRGLATGSQVTGTEFALTHLAVRATGPAAVRLRTRTGWSDWRDVAGCTAGNDRKPGGRLLLADGASGYEVQVKNGGTASVLELNAVDGPRHRTAAPLSTLRPPAGSQLPPALRAGSSSGLPFHGRPRYSSRAAWGADERYRLEPDGVTLDTPPDFHPVQTLTVHHSGGGEQENDGIDAAAWMRAIYYMQAVEYDWGDFGYQLAIDADGNVYEGTYSDPDPVPVFGPKLSPVHRPMVVTGSHVGGFNAGNIGICLIGHFMTRQPTPAARRSLTAVLAMLSAVCGLNPTGTKNYVNPVNAKTATIDTISGHRDWHTATPAAGETDCPGDVFYQTFTQLRHDVRDLLR
ncbi:peptidoglycan recognition family protein [Actinoplanes sp. NPDC049265]|uniref:peptidoglycan recognition protein family protein n=1 Tax=Actinoplanes sp. NPDC049265 TaxID=3363902 RepID=UPI00371B94BA